MTIDSYSFICKKYEPNDDGTVSHYIFEVTNKESGITEKIPVKPEELVSPKKLRGGFMRRAIYYSATKKDHEQMLHKIFPTRPIAI